MEAKHGLSDRVLNSFSKGRDYPSLVKRGKGRFSKQVDSETGNSFCVVIWIYTLKFLRKELLYNKFSKLRHEKKMKHNKKTSWIFVAILIALLAAGGSMAWAAPPDGKDGANQTAAGPAVSNSSGVVAPVSARATTSGAVQRSAIDGELIGTLVVEGGTSYAVFQSAKGTRLVREGDEIAGGVRLVQIRRNRIDVERNGVREEIRLGWSEGVGQQVRPGSTRVASGKEMRALLREDLRAKGRL